MVLVDISGIVFVQPVEAPEAADMAEPHWALEFEPDHSLEWRGNWGSRVHMDFHSLQSLQHPAHYRHLEGSHNLETQLPLPRPSVPNMPRLLWDNLLKLTLGFLRRRNGRYNPVQPLQPHNLDQHRKPSAPRHTWPTVQSGHHLSIQSPFGAGTRRYRRQRQIPRNYTAEED